MISIWVKGQTLEDNHILQKVDLSDTSALLSGLELGVGDALASFMIRPVDHRPASERQFLVLVGRDRGSKFSVHGAKDVFDGDVGARDGGLDGYGPRKEFGAFDGELGKRGLGGRFSQLVSLEVEADLLCIGEGEVKVGREKSALDEGVCEGAMDLHFFGGLLLQRRDVDEPGDERGAVGWRRDELWGRGREL